MEKREIVLSGEEYTGEEFIGSIAEFILPEMKLQTTENILQVDLKTKESINAPDFLRSSLEVTEGLIKMGLKEGDVVVQAAPNSIRFHVSAMGIFFSGGIFSPIDHNLKPFEIQHLLSQFQPKYIICEAETARKFQSCSKASNVNAKIMLLDYTPEFGNEFLSVDAIKTPVDVGSYTPRRVADPKTSIALISCSSGSTGLPKGVALSHYSLILTSLIIENMKIDGFTKNFLLTSPLYWISSSSLLLQSCYTGATRYIPESLDPKDLLAGIEKGKPFFITPSPAVLLSLVEHPNFQKHDLGCLKAIVTGGSVLGSNTIDKVKAKWKGIIFFQVYGMTEVAGPITIPTDHENINSVGLLVPEMKMKIVDTDTGDSLGPNKIGECRVKTKRIMNCYYNNEESTKSSFDENGWLKTGDLAYYDEDGLVYIVGRIKEIIKYRNYQISPTEIESYINGLPGVQDVAIVPVPHEEDTFHLKALVVRSPNSDITAEFIIQSVKDNLSESKHLRKGVEFVDKLPRTEIGKLRRIEVNTIGQKL